MKPASLRQRLALSYAGMALLTVLALGAILAVALPPFFAQVEQQNLKSAAALVWEGIRQSGGIGSKNANLQSAVESLALENQVRIRIFDKTGTLLADSGAAEGAGSRSDATYSGDVLNPDGKVVGHLELSGGPKAGAGLTAGITWAWAVAALLAASLSALLGYFVAGRLARPITELRSASARMATGDLTVRADVSGDSEMRALAESFNEMAGGMQETFETLSRFVGDAAHEIGTPLTALQADLELAREEPADPAVPELLERSLGHAERIRRLTRDMLALSRLESVGSAGKRERLDFGDLVTTVVDAHASRAEQKGVELDYDPAPERLWVVGDAGALAAAVGNLLDNALKFTPEDGRVEVLVQRAEDSAVLRVADNGCGIPVEDLAHVFERFHRARGSAGVPGSGLGLAIVQATVNAHGGSVALSSDERGTVAEMRLPAAPGTV